MAGVVKLISQAFGPEPYRESSPTGSRNVRLVDSNCSAETRAGQITLARLSGKEEVPLRELAERLAEKLYRDELRHGGWAVDLGLLGPKVFSGAALHEIEAGNGVLLEDYRNG